MTSFQVLLLVSCRLEFSFATVWDAGSQKLSWKLRNTDDFQLQARGCQGWMGLGIRIFHPCGAPKDDLKKDDLQKTLGLGRSRPEILRIPLLISSWPEWKLRGWHTNTNWSGVRCMIFEGTLKSSMDLDVNWASYTIVFANYHTMTMTSWFGDKCHARYYRYPVFKNWLVTMVIKCFLQRINIHQAWWVLCWVSRSQRLFGKRWPC